jgi:hypothetical protein
MTIPGRKVHHTAAMCILVGSRKGTPSLETSYCCRRIQSGKAMGPVLKRCLGTLWSNATAFDVLKTGLT